MAPVKRPVILFVLPWSLRFIGGVNQVVTNLALQMRDAGQFEPLVLMADWAAPVPVFEEINGVRTVRWRVRPYQGAMGVKARLAYILWELGFRKRFARFCREHDVQAVNVHYPGGMAFTLERVLKATKSRAPFLLSFHGSDVSNLANSSASEKDAWRGLVRNSDAVVTCSLELAKRVETALAMAVRYHVIYNGVDADKFAGGAGAQVAEENSVILHVGKFDYNKGQDVLIEAFARIAADFPGTILHLVGSSGSQLDNLRLLAANLGLAERVRFFIDIPFAQIPEYFAEASVFAFPSRQEAFGLVLLEAGTCKLPVVASRVGGIPELIHDQLTGLLVEPDDVASLAQALRTLLGDPAFAHQLGRRLSKRVAADFSWENTRDRYEKLICDISQSALPAQTAA